MKIEKEIQDKIINDYLNNICVNHLEQKYNISQYFINKILDLNNIKRPGRGNWRITLLDTNKQEMIEMFENGANFIDIAKHFDCDGNTISNHFKSLGIKSRPQTLLQRKYNINENFFENPNKWKKEQAYFLGWLLSDGYLHYERNSIHIALQEGDVDVLNKLKGFIEYTGNLYYIKKGYIIKDGKRYKEQNQYKLSIHNKKICSDLKNVVNFKNKSFDLEFPKFLNKNLLDVFLLAFWEGDGCVTFGNEHNNLHPSVSFVGTENVCKSIQKLLKKELNINAVVEFPKQYKNNTKVLRFAGNVQVLKFLCFIYKNAPCFLNRKFNKFKQLVELLNLKNNYRDKKLEDKTKKEIEKCEELIALLTQKFQPMD